MIHGELIVDNFAGGGGASTGIELATGYSLVDNKDLIIAMIKDNDKETLQDEIYAELTEE